MMIPYYQDEIPNRPQITIQEIRKYAKPKNHTSNDTENDCAPSTDERLLHVTFC